MTSSVHTSNGPAVSPENMEEKSSSHPEPVNDEGTVAQYPSGLKLAIIMVALCLAVFCVALDNTVSRL
jgi:hypothetical protein